MADDNILRSYRSNDQARRSNAPAASRDIGGSDPLAELARLIGQSDPFADLDRNRSPSAETRQRAEPAPSDWRKTAAALARESMREPPVTDSRFEELDAAIADAKSLRARPDDPFAHPTSYPPISAHAHADVDRAELHQDDYVDSPYHDEPQFGDHIDDRLHASYQGAQQGDHESENYFFEGAAAPTDQDFYDDPPRARTTNGLVTAIVLVGCGILGTVGAYGYRTYYSSARPTDAPIISAEKSPSKMVPAPAGSDAQSGKSMERVGDSNERVVARQEEPMTLPDPNGPRVVLPAPFTTSPGPGPAVIQSNPPPPAVTQSNSPPSAAATEPKKVHTVAIRPDGPDPMSRPVGTAGLPPLQTAPSPPTATTRQPTASKQPARNGGGPLSLEPQAQAQASEMASSYQQPATPQRPVSAPTGAPRLASVSAAAPSGGYMVQVSSQRSEADAQESFRSLQSKFPAQLGDREAVVRRADLGAQGIYFRAMVGPFGTAGDADQFCSSLKAAGGKCILQKN